MDELQTGIKDPDPHYYDIKFETVQLAFFALEFSADGTNLISRDPLICHTLVVIVYKSLSDIDSNDLFGIRSKFS